MQQRSARQAARRSMRLSRAIRSFAESLEFRLLLSTYSVSSDADSGPGTLRDAISNSTADSIQLGGSASIVLNSQLEITRSLTIFGPGVSTKTISGHNTTRIFQIDSGATVQIDFLTISNGHSAAHGGAIFNSGTLVMASDTVSGNSAALTGGGIANAGTLTMTNSTISGNSAGTFGGGIINGGTLTVSNCTISNNSATTGGGVDNAATYSATINATTLSGNAVSSGAGGGFANAGTAFVADSTIANNTAQGAAGGQGAGISNSAGTLLATNCTVSGNTADVSGGGARILGGDVTLYNTIVAGNLNSTNASDDIAGGLDAQLPAGRQPSSYNLVGTGGAGGLSNGINGNITGVSDPKLTPLGNYGGPLQTVGILPGSPAVDSGSNALAQDYSASPPRPLFNDDRGMPRIASSTVDIGADELQSEVTVNTTSSQTTSTDGTVSLPQAVAIANTELLPTGVTIRFAPGVTGIGLVFQLELSRTLGAVTIQGSGAAALNVAGEGNSRVFQIDAGVIAEIDGITIAAGRAPGGSANSAIGANGGGILNMGTLTLINDSVLANSAGFGFGPGGNTPGGAGGNGGGIYNAGSLTMVSDLVQGNAAGTGAPGGNSASGGSVGGAGGSGGGIYNSGSMTIRASTFTGNRAGEGGGISGSGGGGGAIYNSGNLDISATILSQNSAGNGGSFGGGSGPSGNGGAGGAVYNVGTLSIADALVSSNSAGAGQNDISGGGVGGNGGGIFSSSALMCRDSTIINNTAGTGASGAAGGSGGGIYVTAAASLTNDTVAGNRAGAGGLGGAGGGIYNNGGSATLINDTVTLNSSGANHGVGAGVGGGIDSNSSATTGVVLGNTIVTGNSPVGTGADVVSRPLTSLGHNLIGVRDGSSGWALSDLTGTAASPLNAQLGPVGYYSSPLPIAPLGPTSPAVGTGDPTLVTNPPFAGPPFTDEIGLPRIRQSSQGTPIVDIGAVSYRSIPLVVTATSDQNPGLGNLTLDAAVHLAQLSPGDQVITFNIPTSDPGYNSAAHSYAIQTNSSLDLSRALGTITIRGPGAGIIQVSPPGQQAFLLGVGAQAEIDGITINRGGSTSAGGGIFNNGFLMLSDVVITNCSATSGGGIANNGMLTMLGCTISLNSASSDGGGLVNSGRMVVTDSTFSGNVAATHGGGIDNLSDGIATITAGTFSANTASEGAGIANEGALTLTGSALFSNTASASGGGIDNTSGVAAITASTFSGNGAHVGAGVSNEGTLTLLNSTVAGNTSSAAGGGVDDGLGTLTITNCTIAGNTTHATGGGLSIDGGPFGADTTIYNTLIAANHNGSGSADDIAGTFDLVLAPNQQPSSNNLIGTGGSGGLTNGTNGNIVGVTDPKLGPLANNGGPTQTLALLAGSPAIDHGSNALANAAGLTTDQRGFGRIYNRVVDIGAFEFGSTLPGDLNHDGAVNFADLLALAQNYGASNATWEQGDLNGDGSVNFADLLILAQNYGRGTNGSPAAAASAVDSVSGVKLRAAPLSRMIHHGGTENTEKTR